MEKITEEFFVNYYINRELNALKKFNITPTPDQIKKSKNEHAQKFKDIQNNGVDIGTISKCMIFGDIVYYNNEIYIQDKKTKKLYTIE
jgi:hypothetical protein